MWSAVCFDVYDRDGVGAIKLEQLKTILSCVMRTEDQSQEQEESELFDQERECFALNTECLERCSSYHVMK